MDELLSYIVKSLVSQPDEVSITQDSQGDFVTLNLAVHPDDMGLVIGKGGQTIRAIRKLLIARAMVENLKINLNLADVAAR